MTGGSCQQELCPNWSGDGNVCPCAIFDLDPPVALAECMCGDGCEDGRCEL